MYNWRERSGDYKYGQMESQRGRIIAGRRVRHEFSLIELSGGSEEKFRSEPRRAGDGGVLHRSPQKMFEPCRTMLYWKARQRPSIWKCFLSAYLPIEHIHD